MYSVPGITKAYVMGLYPETLDEKNPLIGIVHYSQNVLKGNNYMYPKEDSKSSSSTTSVNNLPVIMT